MPETSAAACVAAEPQSVSRTWTPGLYLELAKARLCALVLVTTLVGFLLAAPGPLDWPQLAWTLLGTGLAAFGANALNQCIEVSRDARMNRTCGRPLPARKLTGQAAWTFALATGILGPLVLALLVNPLAAALAAITLLLYVLLYTPLKVRTPLNTLVGAVVGAIPPMIGWAGATGGLGVGAWLLAAVLFCWQIPHFLALAWMYRDDYARGGFRMLPVVDQAGHMTCYVITLYTLLLVPLSLSFVPAGLSGPVYAAGALLLGLIWTLLTLRLHLERTRANARRVFLASVIYLPLLLGLLVCDRRTPEAPPPSAPNGYVALYEGNEAASASFLALGDLR